MYRFVLHTVLVLSAITVCVGCGKGIQDSHHCPCFERELPVEFVPIDPVDDKKFVGIKNISFENYPKVDGSTSASVLNMMIACKQLGLNYEWTMSPSISALGEWTVSPVWSDIPEQYWDMFWNNEIIMHSQTHGAFMNLIDGRADIILTHRTISPDEKAHANDIGVKLIETPIASDAFVFVVNKDNPVKSLTINEIKKIYTEKITNWAQVGGKKEKIKVFTRPRNSGSEEIFRTLVMQGMEPADFPEADIGSMSWVFGAVTGNVNSICYSFNTYKNLQARKPCDEVPVLAINDICPTETTIKNGKYPFISKVHVAIRSDLDRNSMAYKLYEWLQSEDAKSTINECGFIPK